jgi:hypothetical protein
MLISTNIKRAINSVKVSMIKGLSITFAILSLFPIHILNHTLKADAEVNAQPIEKIEKWYERAEIIQAFVLFFITGSVAVGARMLVLYSSNKELQYELQAQKLVESAIKTNFSLLQQSLEKDQQLNLELIQNIDAKTKLMIENVMTQVLEINKDLSSLDIPELQERVTHILNTKSGGISNKVKIVITRVDKLESFIQSKFEDFDDDVNI